MRILGLSAYYHDSAAVLLEDGAIVAAAQEERFSRVKHDARFPRQAAAWCLRQARGPLDAVVYYEKPLLKFQRILETSLAVAPRGFRAFAAAIPDWLHHKLWLPGVIEDELAVRAYPTDPDDGPVTPSRLAAAQRLVSGHEQHVRDRNTLIKRAHAAGWSDTDIRNALGLGGDISERQVTRIRKGGSSGKNEYGHRDDRE